MADVQANENVIENDVAVVISDLHVGDPDIDPEFTKKGLDDFNRDDDFQRLLENIIPKRAGWPTTLIINGDFIDFVQVLPAFGGHNAGDRYGVTQNESQLKLKRVMDAHPKVFDALGSFVQKGGQLLILPGNHDIDLHWPRVFQDLRTRIGGAAEPKIHFINEGAISERRVYIEHGNQYSFDNWFEHWADPIRDAPDKRERIERPWGTLFLDLIYNDIKDLYPFSNKVYPQAELAWIALKSFRDDKNVSPRAIARLIWFFAKNGKRFALNHLLGEEDELNSDSISVDDVWLQVSESIDDGRLSDVKAEIAVLEREDREPAINDSDESPLGEGTPAGLLGKNDLRGMARKQKELWESGEVDIVVFGHTHTAIDGNVQPPYGVEDARRVFNPGSWVPNIPIGAKEKLHWKDLEKKKAISDLRFVILDVSKSTARLEPILPPDKN